MACVGGIFGFVSFVMGGIVYLLTLPSMGAHKREEIGRGSTPHDETDTTKKHMIYLIIL